MVIGEEMFSWRQEGRGIRRGNSRNVWGELSRGGWTKERDEVRLCELKAESVSCPTGFKTGLRFEIQIFYTQNLVCIVA